jgi:hypothetical protein
VLAGRSSLTVDESFRVVRFEGARVLACAARAVGAKPLLLMPCDDSREPAAIAEIAYRIGNGTGAVVAPASYAWHEAVATFGTRNGDWPGPGMDWWVHSPWVRAATLYSTLTGRDAATTTYRPGEMDADLAAQLATIAYNNVVAEAAKVHYEGPFRGRVEVRSAPPGGDLWFMNAGSSSEQIWYDRVNDILPGVSLTPHGTPLGYK